ncbi:MAG: phosphatidate cytidylyltransferase [Thermotogae bacterium]|nr:phosphatidate cytidylyltransferase [Thermotogota bacterium]MCP5465107.1 phosphatidate cytidylyltransferase [Thermotogota bacterium]
MAVNKKNLVIRVLSGVILGPAVVFSFSIYPTLLGLVTSIVLLSAFEFIEFSNRDFKNVILKLFITLTIGVSTLVYGFALQAENQGILPFDAETIFFIGFAVIMGSIILNVKDISIAKELASSSAVSLLYIAFFLSFFYKFNLQYGPSMSILCLTSVWMYDASAYFFGMNFGKHKLSPVFSPKKSWEGFYGGILGTFVYIIVFEFIRNYMGYNNTINIIYAVIFAVCVGIFDTIGDITESVFKRYYGVKDSGEILPGHGGMLDRIDGLLVVAPIWYFLLRVFLI